MNRSRPFIEVSVGGRPVGGLFYQLLNQATIHDAPGQDADTCELTFDDGGNRIIMPTPGQIITVKFGFRDAGSWKMGTFEVEKPRIEGGQAGEMLILSGRSAAMSKKVKETGSEHFDDKTIGDIVRQIAGKAGYGVKVSPELASIRIGYIARFNQSPVDFLTRLADRNKALFSVKDGKFLFLKRGELPPLTIDKGDCESWSFTVEPRPRFGEIEATWFDRATGEIRTESHSTGMKGPLKRLRTGFQDAAEAKRAAGSEGDRLGRATGSGSVTLAGLPEAVADQPIETTGFRAEANGEWRAASVEHSFGDTYLTTIELEAPEGGKE